MSSQSMVASLTEAELLLVRETDVQQMTDLTEDELLELHARIRRARNKYTNSYRREASANVGRHGGRGKAGPKNTRNRDKAEVFEQALARVSRRLAVSARDSAEQLKAERIAAAQTTRNTAPPAARRAAGPRVTSQRPRPSAASAPATRKKHASTRAAGTRRQAVRDAR